MQRDIERFAELLQQAQDEHFRNNYPHSEPPTVKVHYGRKYARVDIGTSGAYMVDGAGNIFGIKAYGVIHRGHRYGTLDTIHEWNWAGHRARRDVVTHESGQ